MTIIWIRIDYAVNDVHPWKCPRSGKSMTVELNFGKPLFQQYGKGGEAFLEGMEEGQIIQIEAKTNPGQRESLQKWIDTQTLELVVTNCRLLYYQDGGSNIANLTADQQQNPVSPNLPSLSLDNLFYESSVSVELVDSPRDR